MSQQAKRMTRKTKEEILDKSPTNVKYIEENKNKLIQSFTPTTSQKTLINKIKENTITFVDAEAGTGKSSATLFHFCKEYLENPYINIIVVRTPVEIGSDKVGYLPNSLNEKLQPHFSSTKNILEKFLGKGRLEADMDKRIHFKIPNYMLGSTIDNSLVLIDEAQQLQPMILKLLLERIGKDTKVVVAGCSNQLYSTGKDRNSLADAIHRFFVKEGSEYFPRYDNVAHHEFDIEDVMRDPIVKTVIRAYKGVGGI